MDALPDDIRGEPNPDCIHSWIGVGDHVERGSARRCCYCNGMARGDNPVFLITFYGPVSRINGMAPGVYCQGCVRDYDIKRVK